MVGICAICPLDSANALLSVCRRRDLGELDA